MKLPSASLNQVPIRLWSSTQSSPKVLKSPTSLSLKTTNQPNSIDWIYSTLMHILALKWKPSLTSFSIRFMAFWSRSAKLIMSCWALLLTTVLIASSSSILAGSRISRICFDRSLTYRLNYYYYHIIVFLR